jgi:hypothetical protein
MGADRNRRRDQHDVDRHSGPWKDKQAGNPDDYEYQCDDDEHLKTSLIHRLFSIAKNKSDALIYEVPDLRTVPDVLYIYVPCRGSAIEKTCL